MRIRNRGLALAAAVAVVAGAAGVYLAVRAAGPAITGSGCQAGTGSGAVELEPGQAAIAATIAAVARQRAMPARAVEVAYAAALQESHLQDLGYGDRDSVGVFQQRPSQGWGPRRRLLDPVFATTRFFQVLATVRGYQRMPVYRAAQAVQRSADGFAYQQYQPLAAQLTGDFTGAHPHAVWCWSPAATPGPARLTAARRALRGAFGPALAATAAGHPATMVVGSQRAPLGWAVAAWLVTHAAVYGIHEVRYQGYRWQADAGQAGWSLDKAPLAGSEIRAS